MPGRAYQLNVFRIIEEIIDGKITGAVPVVYLLGDNSAN
jgi:hypothetical protein